VTPDKQALPHPYDQDFTHIVTRIKTQRPAARSRRVNSVVVASYIRAGATLIERHLGPTEAAQAAANDVGKQNWSIRFLTERAVIKEAEQNEPPFLRIRGEGTFRATWASHDDYLRDLLAFMFDEINYYPQHSPEAQKRDFPPPPKSNFVDLVDHRTYCELQAICRMALFRLQLLMVATAHRNDGIHDVIANNYGGAIEPWKKVYESTFAAHGFRLRAGITIDQFANIMSAVTEGIAVRVLGDPNANVNGDRAEGNLLGMAVLGLIYAYLEPANKPSGRTLRQEFEEIEEAARPPEGKPYERHADDEK